MSWFLQPNSLTPSRWLAAVLAGVLPLLLLAGVAFTLLEQEAAYGVALLGQAANHVQGSVPECRADRAATAETLRHGAELMRQAVDKGQRVLLVFAGLSVLVLGVLGGLAVRHLQGAARRWQPPGRGGSLPGGA